ncbi:hypothetical protein H4S02_002725 [Coemansia sp. RSA 2611]|nr:hypothetical protein H4S02_002725 [Coemansia sp. RSA 2611]
MDSISEVFRPLNVLVGFSAYAAWRVLYALYLSPLRNVPGPFWARVSALPMFWYDIRGKEPEFMQRNCAKYGSVFVMEPDKVGICGLEECQMVLNSHAFLKDRRYGQVDFIEPNLFLTRDPELNRHRRRQIGPALNPVGLRQMEPTILDSGVQQLMTKWDQAIAASPNGQSRIQYFYDFSDMSFDVICSLGFGLQHRSLTTGDRQMTSWVRKTTSLIFVQMCVPFLTRTPFRQTVLRSLYSSARKFVEFGVKVIAQRKHEIAAGGERRNDLLQAFIDAEDPLSKAHMTPEQITSETIISIFGGTDTSSNTLSWAVHLLLLHPHYLQRVQAEVRQAFAPGHLVRYEEAKARLPFLEACLYETLRIRSPGNNLPRCISRGGVVLKSYFIPDTCTCSVSIGTCNLNEETWNRPHDFNPDRFIENPENKRKVLTFSAGVRVCPGRHLAWWEMMTTMANVLKNYELQLPEDALFTPNQRDEEGRPLVMPYNQAITCSPRYPDRDCNVLVSKHVI